MAKKFNPNYLTASEEELTKLDDQMSFLASDIQHYSTKFSEEFSKLMAASTVKPYIKNKFCAMYYNAGLLARLLGYDAISHKCKNERKVCIYDIVNPSVVVVCGDVEEEKEVTAEKSFDEKIGF